MARSNYFPTYRQVNFAFNPESGWFEKTASQPEPYPVNAVPYALRREQTRATQIKCNAADILTKKDKRKTNGSLQLFTGLQSIGLNGWFVGDAASFRDGKKVKSLLIVCISNEGARMQIYYFPAWYKQHPEQRKQFAKDFAIAIQNKAA